MKRLFIFPCPAVSVPPAGRRCPLAEDFDGRVQVVNNHRISVTQYTSRCWTLPLWPGPAAAPWEIRQRLEDEKQESSIYIMVGHLEVSEKRRAYYPCCRHDRHGAEAEAGSADPGGRSWMPTQKFAE